MTVEGGWGLAWLTGSGAVTSSWDSWEGDSPALLPCQIYPLGLKGENIWEKIGHIEGKRSGSYGPVYNVHVSRGAPESSWQRPLRGRWPWPGRCQIFGVTRLHARMTPRRNAATATQQETESSPFPSSRAGSAPSPTQAASSEVALHTPVGIQQPPALGLPRAPPSGLHPRPLYTARHAQGGGPAFTGRLQIDSDTREHRPRQRDNQTPRGARPLKCTRRPDFLVICPKSCPSGVGCSTGKLGRPRIQPKAGILRAGCPASRSQGAAPGLGLLGTSL